MKIGIIADTHDQIARTGRAVGMLVAAGAETLIHCGDLTGPDIVYECAQLPCFYVFGNNDFDDQGLKQAMELVGAVCLGWTGIVELLGQRIAVTHGDSTREMRRLALNRPDYLLFGHTHVLADHRDGPTRFINPGALHRASSWTVALLDLNADALRFLLVR
jgi:putative phosphoesterase